MTTDDIIHELRAMSGEIDELYFDGNNEAGAELLERAIQF